MSMSDTPPNAPAHEHRDSQPRPEDLSRDELVEREYERRAMSHRMDRLEALVGTIAGVDAHEAGFTDVTIGGNAIGKVVNSHTESIQALEKGEVGGGTISESVRHELLPIHRMAVDVQVGEDVDNASPRRAARLFQRFLDLYLSDEARYEVNKDNGMLKMMAKTAKRVLKEEGDIPESGQSTVVKRAMKQMQSLSKEEDCGCNSLEDCDHGLMVWTKRKSQHTIVADVEAFEAYLQRVEDAKNGSASSTISDDSSGASRDEDGKAEETNTDVSQSAEDDTFDQLDQAEAVTDDTSDTVENSIETQVEPMTTQTDGGQRR